MILIQVMLVAGLVVSVPTAFLFCYFLVCRCSHLKLPGSEERRRWLVLTKDAEVCVIIRQLLCECSVALKVRYYKKHSDMRYKSVIQGV